MCADLLEGWLTWREGRPAYRALLQRADSIYLVSDVASDWQVTNLVIARLREATETPRERAARSGGCW